MRITEYLRNNRIYLDGGMGTLLQSGGLLPGELPERWNITNPDKIIAIHKAYFDAGSNVVNTNTFGANGIKFESDELERMNELIESLISAYESKDSSQITKYCRLIADLCYELSTFEQISIESVL